MDKTTELVVDFQVVTHSLRARPLGAQLVGQDLPGRTGHHQVERIELYDLWVTKLVDRIQQKLGRNGRVLVRWSGTEAKLRVMVEGPDKRDVDRYAKEIGKEITIFTACLEIYF